MSNSHLKRNILRLLTLNTLYCMPLLSLHSKQLISLWIFLVCCVIFLNFHPLALTCAMNELAAPHVPLCCWFPSLPLWTHILLFSAARGFQCLDSSSVVNGPAQKIILPAFPNFGPVWVRRRFTDLLKAGAQSEGPGFTLGSAQVDSLIAQTHLNIFEVQPA